ncbi:hypothetical protein [Plasmodium yoelii yoelii]|uniref:Uncharacterized protein n=1 Tax=Plasmodium yoelii yoelii TaxID=73239 RepID=Q7RNV2_PLAYO|nr:hypothetical protein [Plasmodium yoelii yoelii]
MGIMENTTIIEKRENKNWKGVTFSSLIIIKKIHKKQINVYYIHFSLSILN